MRQVSDQTKPKPNVAVVIPNWNGAADLPDAIDSVLKQSYSNFILIVVDNGSTDGSKDIIKKYCRRDSRVTAIWRDKNYGFTGGVNPGLELAIDLGCKFAALFNNDAVADKHWLKLLLEFLNKQSGYGIAACKLLHADGKTIDSSGDTLSNWGLPYPRGRNELDVDKYDEQTEVFGASGGASLYRVNMLKEIGLFDEDFFAYYEDVDLSFRAQLAGWKVSFVPASVVFHKQGGTSKRLGSGFSIYQERKNRPLILFKNVPRRYLFTIGWRFLLTDTLTFLYLFRNGRGWIALKGSARSAILMIKKIPERRYIQKTQKVSDEYIWSILTHDLPPNAPLLKKLRSTWWKITGKAVN